MVLFKKFIGKRDAAGAGGSADSPESLIARIQEGDMKLRNRFIAEYQPYVAKVTSRFCKRYIDPARDDEFSIALAAFNEAINQFSAEGGRSFLGFAETVIRRRLIDYVRKEQRFTGQTPMSSFEVEDEEDNVVNPVEVQEAVSRYEKDQTAEARRSEILDFTRCLSEFGISFEDLISVSPKHSDSRESLFQIAHTLASSAPLMRQLLGTKMLPIKELLENVEVSRKTLERNRKYIIATALIYFGPYPYLKEYLQMPGSQAERSDTDE
nr:RNA polymerase sigma factor SigI [Paenibacillus turpanensis]